MGEVRGLNLVQEKRLHVLIIGAGLCGLATAISIACAGYRATVFEAVDEIREAGAGIQITPNGTRLLEAWGLGPRLQGKASAPQTFSMYRYDGRILARRNDYDKEIKSRYGAPIWCLHRADLQVAMVDRALELGVDFKLGRRVKTVYQEAATIVLEGEQVVAGDAVVAADGLWSSTRAEILGSPLMPKPTGDLAYRILLDLKCIQELHLKEWLKKPGIHIWVGPNVHAVAYSIRNGSLLNLVLCVPDDLPEDVARAKGSLEEMRKLFVGWDPVLTGFLKYADSVDKWRLMYLEPLSTWRTRSGFCVMGGDACHPILPYMAQGANSSLEDGATLGSLLGQVSSKEQVPSAFSLYDNIRRPRIERLVKETFVQAKEHHLHDGPEQVARDELLSRSFVTTEEEDAPWTHPKIQPWIYSYNAYEVVRRACDEQIETVE